MSTAPGPACFRIAHQAVCQSWSKSENVSSQLLAYERVILHDHAQNQSTNPNWMDVNAEKLCTCDRPYPPGERNRNLGINMAPMWWEDLGSLLPGIYPYSVGVTLNASPDIIRPFETQVSRL